MRTLLDFATRATIDQRSADEMAKLYAARTEALARRLLDAETWLTCALCDERNETVARGDAGDLCRACAADLPPYVRVGLRTLA